MGDEFDSARFRYQRDLDERSREFYNPAYLEGAARTVVSIQSGNPHDKSAAGVVVSVTKDDHNPQGAHPTRYDQGHWFVDPSSGSVGKATVAKQPEGDQIPQSIRLLLHMLQQQPAHQLYDAQSLNQYEPSDLLTLYPAQSGGAASTAPETTIRSLAEGDSTVLEVEVQMEHTGKGVISSQDADVSCRDLGLAGLLQRLNAIFGTEHAISNPDLQILLQDCIDSGYDLGMTYAFLGPIWTGTHPTSAARKARDEKTRESAVDHSRNVIPNPSIPRHRLWDLKANRVVPWWMANPTWENICVLSQSWIPEDRRHNIQTSINSHEWPVPIPIDTTLERIRVELLNISGTEYAWLDVLYLRQQDKDVEKEKIRLEKWKLDIPTIGHVYRAARRMIPYYSGLGRPFRVGDLRSRFHWLNRAWTLQETRGPEPLTAGGNDDVPCRAAGIVANSPSEENASRDKDTYEFFEKLNETNSHVSLRPLLDVLSAMRGRSAAFELDRVAGLYYPLKCNILPVYIRDETPQDAWVRLVKLLSSWYLTELLLVFPAADEQAQTWYPSWSQVLQTPWAHKGEFLRVGQNVVYDHDSNTFYFRGLRRDNCILLRLDEPPKQVQMPPMSAQDAEPGPSCITWSRNIGVVLIREDCECCRRRDRDDTASTSVLARLSAFLRSFSPCARSVETTTAEPEISPAATAESDYSSGHVDNLEEFRRDVDALISGLPRRAAPRSSRNFRESLLHGFVPFSTTPRHFDPIADGIYTLIGTKFGNKSIWAVGHMNDADRFEKLSVSDLSEPEAHPGVAFSAFATMMETQLA